MPGRIFVFGNIPSSSGMDMMVGNAPSLYMRSLTSAGKSFAENGYPCSSQEPEHVSESSVHRYRGIGRILDIASISNMASRSYCVVDVMTQLRVLYRTYNTIDGTRREFRRTVDGDHGMVCNSNDDIVRRHEWVPTHDRMMCTGIYSSKYGVSFGIFLPMR